MNIHKYLATFLYLLAILNGRTYVEDLNVVYRLSGTVTNI